MSHASSAQARIGQHTNDQSSLQAALREAFKPTVTNDELVPGPKVSVRRKRRIGFARPEQASQQPAGERLARVFVLKQVIPVDEAPAMGVETIEAVASVRSVLAPRQVFPAPPPAHPEEPATTAFSAGAGEEATPHSFATPRGRKRRRVPDFKKPGAVVVIKSVGDDVVATHGEQAQESSANTPRLADLKEQLAKLSFTGHPERFVFDLSRPSRWDEVDRALEELRVSVEAFVNAAADYFMPAGRRQKRSGG